VKGPVHCVGERFLEPDFLHADNVGLGAVQYRSDPIDLGIVLLARVLQTVVVAHVRDD
jgi:hypothetical protein